MVKSPAVDSSMRSKHTGQVGSSMSAGVGGAIGFVKRLFEEGRPLLFGDVFFAPSGEKGSLAMSGKVLTSSEFPRALNSMDLTKTTWQFSG